MKSVVIKKSDKPGKKMMAIFTREMVEKKQHILGVLAWMTLQLQKIKHNARGIWIVIGLVKIGIIQSPRVHYPDGFCGLVLQEVKI